MGESLFKHDKRALRLEHRALGLGTRWVLFSLVGGEETMGG